MDIPPPWLPPPPPPAPKREACPAPPPPPTGWQALRQLTREPLSWATLRDALHPGVLFGGMGTPFDLIEIFNSAVVQLVFRLLRLVAILGFAVAIGGVSLALRDLDWDDPRSWPAPMEVLEDVGKLVDGFEDAMALALLGVGSYVLSFVACLRSWFVIPFVLAGFVVQVLWVVRALSEEDEEPWLLASVVPVVAWQIFAGYIDWYRAKELVLPVAFLVAFTICWVAAFVMRGWMRRRDLSLWEFIDTHRHRFDPAFYRWRKVTPAAPAPPAAAPDSPAPPP